MAFTTLEDFLAKAEAQLDPIEGHSQLPETGDLEHIERDMLNAIRPAAVLVPVIPRPSGATVLLTQRPETMAAHPGQVAFPGGKIDPGDANDVAAALREAEEEVGVDPASVGLIGRAAPYITGTAYRIVPVIGVLPADFKPVPDPTEVADVFEAPLDYLFKKANYHQASAFWKGKQRQYTEMFWDGFRIWGVTAGIIRVLYKTLYEQEEG
ncbi:MAG: CoA pyrophosphatase [Henriciella sp.]